MRKNLLVPNIIILVGSFLLISVFPAFAQADQNEVSLDFSELGVDEFTILQGPYQMHTLQFRLPSNWEFKDGAHLNLNFTTFFSLYVSIQGNEEVDQVFAGALSIYLNGKLLESHVVEQDGQQSLEVALPRDVLQSTHGLISLAFEWDSTHACYQNIFTYILLDNNSTIKIPYSKTSVSTSLADFPMPFYSPGSLFPRETGLVIPSSASADEISAAMAVSTGLERFSKGELSVKLFHEDQLDSSILDDYDWILIGDISEFGVLSGTDIPSQYNSRILGYEITEKDGVIASFVSPFDPSHLLVVISGDSDEAVKKAGQAFGSGEMLLNAEQNLVVIKEYLSGEAGAVVPEQFALVDLGVSDIVFTDFGTNKVEFEFVFPQGASLSSGVYIDINYNHSRLLDYLTSNMWVEINDVYISSVQFNDNNADLSMARFIIPPTAVVGGRNVLTIGTHIAARNICADPRAGDIWVQVFADSSFILPRMEQSVAIKLSKVNSFPEMFVTFDDLQETIFVISDDNFDAWQAAVKISGFIGSQTPGNSSFAGAVFLGEINEDIIADKNIILISEFEDLSSSDPPILWEILPIESSGEFYALVGDRSVYYLDEKQDYGLLSLAEFESGNVGLGIVTKGSDVVGWTADMLLNDQLLTSLSTESFVIVQGPQAVLMNVKTVPEEAMAERTLPEGLEAETEEETEVDEALTYAKTQNRYVSAVLFVFLAVLLVLLREVYINYKEGF